MNPARPTKESLLSPLLYWVRAREHIRKRRAAGDAPPWTTDLILQKFRFCNVRRRDDRVSQWLLKHVLTKENYNAQGAYRFALFTAFCRWVNWPPSIAAILEQVGWPGPSDYGKVAEVLTSLPGKVWTGAYMIKSGQGGWKGKPKAEFICREVVEASLVPVASDLATIMKDTRSKQRTWELLTTRKEWGSFMSGQVVDDWSWTSLFGQGALDDKTWAPQGPGSTRGYNRLLGRPLKQSVKPELFVAQLQEWRWVLIQTLGPEYEDLSLMDFQNILCECDKWLRVKNNEGRPRSMYSPETAYTI